MNKLDVCGTILDTPTFSFCSVDEKFWSVQDTLNDGRSQVLEMNIFNLVMFLHSSVISTYLVSRSWPFKFIFTQKRFKYIVYVKSLYPDSSLLDLTKTLFW